MTKNNIGFKEHETNEHFPICAAKLAKVGQRNTNFARLLQNYLFFDMYRKSPQFIETGVENSQGNDTRQPDSSTMLTVFTAVPDSPKVLVPDLALADRVFKFKVAATKLKTRSIKSTLYFI